MGLSGAYLAGRVQIKKQGGRGMSLHPRESPRARRGGNWPAPGRKPLCTPGAIPQALPQVRCRSWPGSSFLKRCKRMRSNGRGVGIPTTQRHKHGKRGSLQYLLPGRLRVRPLLPSTCWAAWLVKPDLRDVAAAAGTPLCALQCRPAPKPAPRRGQGRQGDAQHQKTRRQTCGKERSTWSCSSFWGQGRATTSFTG